MFYKYYWYPPFFLLRIPADGRTVWLASTRLTNGKISRNSRLNVSLNKTACQVYMKIYEQERYYVP